VGLKNQLIWELELDKRKGHGFESCPFARIFVLLLSCPQNQTISNCPAIVLSTKPSRQKLS